MVYSSRQISASTFPEISICTRGKVKSSGDIEMNKPQILFSRTEQTGGGQGDVSSSS